LAFLELAAFRQRQQIILPNTVSIGLQKLIARSAGSDTNPSGCIALFGVRILSAKRPKSVYMVPRMANVLLTTTALMGSDRVRDAFVRPMLLVLDELDDIRNGVLPTASAVRIRSADMSYMLVRA